MTLSLIFFSWSEISLFKKSTPILEGATNKLFLTYLSKINRGFEGYTYWYSMEVFPTLKCLSKSNKVFTQALQSI